MYLRSTDLITGHRKCLTRQQFIDKIKEDHAKDHRGPETVYESSRKHFYPAVREHIKVVFKQEVHCVECSQVMDLPKTTLTRRPIPASYPNSRWQMDLKKMPSYNGFNYIVNVVDCYSRFAFGGSSKGKSAAEVADLLMSKMYTYGPPRILQTDNGREFNNNDLVGVMNEFKIRHINGRPYHPQSQGRVERFNRSVVEYFKRTIVKEPNWPRKLDYFYYQYNNRTNKATRPSTPFQLFFGRSNNVCTTTRTSSLQQPVGR